MNKTIKKSNATKKRVISKITPSMKRPKALLVGQNPYTADKVYVKEWNNILTDVISHFDNYRDEFNRPVFTSITLFAKDYGFNRGFPMVLTHKILDDFIKSGYFVGYTAVDSNMERLDRRTEYTTAIRACDSITISLEPLDGTTFHPRSKWLDE